MSENLAGLSAIAGVVERQRLYDVLDSPLVRVWVVQGPSGSGKTTLLRSWTAQHQDRRVVWMSLGEDTANRQSFWQHVAARVTSGRADLAGTAGQEMRWCSDAAVDPVLIVAGSIAAAGPTLLVLDAYEHLGEEGQAIDEDLARLLRASPEVSVMITTRSTTTLVDLNPAIASVRVVSLAELLLNEAEVAELIEQSTGTEAGRLARSVVTATGGFPLTVRAMVLALSQLGSIPPVDSPHWGEVVAAKLESLLPDAATVRFVTCTSIPSYVDVQLAESLTGNPDAAAMLGALEQAGFGRWLPYARQRPVFQYVQTIRDAFRARAAEDPDLFRSSLNLTSRWLVQNDEVDQALVVAIEATDYEFADRLFVALLIEHPDSYVTDRFLRTLQAVPEPVLTECPMLAFGLGLAMMANPLLRTDAPRIFDIAADATSSRTYLDSPTLDELVLASMRAIALRLAGRQPEATITATGALARIDDLPDEVVVGHGEPIGTMVRQLGYTVFLGGHTSQALAAIDRSVTICRTQTARNYSLACATGISAFTGDNRRAQRLEALIDPEAWPVEFHASSLNGLRHVAQGYRFLDALDFDAAVDVLDSTIPYMQTNEYWPLITGILVSARTGLGHGPAEAERVLRELSGTTPRPGIGHNSATEALRSELAFALLAGNDHHAAADVLDQTPTDSPFAAAARIASLLAAGHDRSALEASDRLADLRGHTLRTRAQTLTVGAVAALRRGNDTLALAWLSQAAITWESYGPRRHAALLPPPDRRMLWELARDRHARIAINYLDIPATGATPAAHSAVTLSPRERVVLATLVTHTSARGIADELVVSPHTVKSQLQSLYRKLGVSSRRSALAVAFELGLIDASQADL